MRQFFSVAEPTDPTNKDLATLEDVKLELGITGTTDDAKLTALISRISGAIGDYCDRLFSLEDATEIFVFDVRERFLSRQPLLLRQYPVVEIESVTMDGVELLSDAYEFDLASGRIWLVSGAWSGRVEVHYTGGFDLPDEAPPALQWALIEAMRQRLAFSSADPTVRSTAHGDTSVSFYSEPTGGASGFSGAIISALQPYRRITV